MSLRQRALGCLLGHAVGDALGARYEFMSVEGVAAAVSADMRIVGTDGVLPMLGGGPFHMARGQVTDDTEMSMAMARCVPTHLIQYSFNV